MKLIPTPTEILMGEGKLALSAIQAVAVKLGSDQRLVKIASKVRNEIMELTGTVIKLTTAIDAPAASLFISHGDDNFSFCCNDYFKFGIYMGTAIEPERATKHYKISLSCHINHHAFSELLKLYIICLEL